MIILLKLDSDSYRLEMDGFAATAHEGRFGLRWLIRKVERKRGRRMSAEEIEEIEEALGRDGVIKL